MKLNNWIMVVLIVVVAVLVGAGILKANDPGVTYYWSHPEAGAPIDHYRGHQMFIAGTETTSVYIDNIPRGDEQGTWTVDYQFGMVTLFRVVGVDSLHREGPWSLWSDPWIDDGPPTEPGKPSQTLTVNPK